jgi:WD40 repeat protein
VGYRDGWVRLWDFDKAQLLKELKEHHGNNWGVSVEFSKDDRWLAALPPGSSSLVLFDLSDLNQIRPFHLTKDSSSTIFSLGFTPDNKTLITQHNDGLIKFWNLSTLGVALTLRHSYAPGGHLSLSSDGNLLATKDAQGTLKLWSATPADQIPKSSNVP